MIPITKPYIDDNEIQAVIEVLKSGWLVQGEKVKQFENGVSELVHVGHACATTSCTTALQLAMLAEGMGEGMDVLIPSFTYVATANAVVSTGAVPVICDIDEDTFNLDPECAEEYINRNYVYKQGKWHNRSTDRILWGIVPIHQFGLCADMESLNRLKEKYEIYMIEDAACALGSRIRDTSPGGFGNTACFSFHPRKSITTGEGGMVITKDMAVYEKIVCLRNHGSKVESANRHKSAVGLLPEFTNAGFNFRMTDIQGAIGCMQLNKLPFILKRRQEIALTYNDLLASTDVILSPYVPAGYFHSYQSYVCRLKMDGSLSQIGAIRNRVMQIMAENGISTRQGTHAVHKLNYYRQRFGFKDQDIPKANLSDLSTISLPVYVDITEDEQKEVVECLLCAIDQVRSESNI